MNKKAFLLFLLLTPLIVIVSSTLAFRFGFGPEATKNNGIFFSEFTDITGMEMSSTKNLKLDFEDGKWVMGICLLYTSPSPRDGLLSRMPSSA